MVKKNKQKTKAKPQPKRAISNRSNPTFGAVSTITTAPTAIGNSMRGFEPKIMRTANGAQVVGRDFAFTATSTGSSITSWCLVGGFPLTPSAFVTSALRSLTQMYSKFKINRLVVHYITSSPTSSNGDVMFHYRKNADDPLPDTNATSFLPFVLSDSNTVIGPQWTNHSALITTTGPYKSTDYFAATGPSPMDNTFGDLILYSKTSSTDSPGYVIIDYDISFKDLQVSPRGSYLPATRAIWTPVALYVSNTAVTVGSTKATNFQFGTSTNDVTGTAGSAPSGVTNGDVYEIVVADTTAYASFANCTTANLLAYNQGLGYTAFTIKRGCTLYATVDSTTNVILHQTYAGALVNTLTDVYYYGVTATVAASIPAFVKLITNVGSNMQYAP